MKLSMRKACIVSYGLGLVVLGLLGSIDNPLIGIHGYFLSNRADNLLTLLAGSSLLFVVLGSFRLCNFLLRVLGGVFVLSALYGFVALSHGGKLFGFLPTNTADYWLQMAIGSGLIILSLYVRKHVLRPSDYAMESHHEGSAQ